MYKKISVLLILLGGILLSACSSKRHISHISSSPAELSNRLGIEISRKDNLKLYDEAASWLGVPYHYGGMSRKGVDCSGLTCVIYKNVYGIQLERTCENMYKKNCRKISRKKLKPGDLVFYNTATKRKSISHVGIYLKDDIFIHATTRNGVRLSNMNEEYYKKRWIKGGKVIN